MILAIDIGNSNVTIGCVDGEKVLFEARVVTDRLKTSDQYAVELKSMLDLYQVALPDIDGAIVASVVPPISNSFNSAVRKALGFRPMMVGPGMKTGLNILCDNPAQVGADLIAAAVAALHLCEPPMAVVDMGTATTISVLNQNGAFLGGSICPGVRISMEALTSGTAQLPGVSLEQPKHVIGRNTIESMQSGLMVGAAAMVDGLVERIEEELGTPVKVIATGGIARFVIPMCKREVLYDRDLVLRGLAILYRNNLKTHPEN